jgi:3-oxoacyl-[acyl-carrier-protein] synthase II
LAAPVATPASCRSAAQRLRWISETTIRQATAAAKLSATDPAMQLVIASEFGDQLDGSDGDGSLYRWTVDVAERLGAERPPVAVSTACAAGSDAILLGTELIRSGAASVCVCGGAEVLTDRKRAAHSALGTLSPTTLRPFDLRHDGMLPGEGAAFLVLESEESAQQRGVQVLARLRGVGSANDAAGMTSPDREGRGARLAIARALADAGIESRDVGLVKAHGSGTPANDQAERQAFRWVFGDGRRPPVFGTKGVFGHALGAAGAMEAIALLLALRTNVVPPIVGLEAPDPEFPCPLVIGTRMDCSAEIGLSVSQGFGGCASCLVVSVAR